MQNSYFFMGVRSLKKIGEGIIHEDYLMHLYGLFSAYCGKAPIIKIRPPNKITGKSAKSIYFNTFSLPCFVELGNLFYPDGKKIIPLNIGDLLTPLSLAYWICDDGCFHKTQRSRPAASSRGRYQRCYLALGSCLHDPWCEGF